MALGRQSRSGATDAPQALGRQVVVVVAHRWTGRRYHSTDRSNGTPIFYVIATRIIRSP